jgi:hypothetical protein
LQLDRGAPWLRKDNLGAGDWKTVLVNYRESDRRAGRRRLSAGKEGTANENQAENHPAGSTTPHDS